MCTRLSARLVAALLATAFSALLVLSALHHHEDEADGHEDCVLCLLKVLPASAPDPAAPAVAPDAVEWERAPSPPAEAGTEAPLPYLARAPPPRSA
jgi:hypothetical protein